MYEATTFHRKNWLKSQQFNHFLFLYAVKAISREVIKIIVCRKSLEILYKLITHTFYVNIYLYQYFLRTNHQF